MKANNRGLATLIVFFVLHGIVSAQNIQLTKSKPQINSSSVTSQKIIGNDSLYYYAVKTQSQRYYIEKLDNNLNPVIKKIVNLNDGLKRLEMIKVVCFYDKLYQFTSRRGLSNNQLFSQELDKNTLEPLTEPVQVFDIKNINGNYAEFKIVLSNKKTKLLVFSSIRLLWSHSVHNDIIVYGKDLDPIWQKTESREVEGEGMYYRSYLVDEIGNVSVMGLIKHESILDLKEEVKNVYSIERYTLHGENFDEYPVFLPNMYIRGIKIAANNKGDLICAGLYSEMFREGIKGTFYFQIDTETGKLQNSSTKPFEKYLWGKMEKLNEPLIANEELIKYTVNNLVLRDNGNVVLMAEQMFDQRYDTYNNIILVCFDENGYMKWSQVVAKKQDYTTLHLPVDGDMDIEDVRNYIIENGSIMTYIENYSSYSLMAAWDENELTLVFNDNIKNLDADKGKMYNLTNPKTSYLKAVHIDVYGNITENVLDTWEKKELYPIPLDYYDNRTGDLVITAVKGRRYQYYKLEKE